MLDSRPDPLTTERLIVVPATVALVEEEIEDPAKLAATLHAELPADWPPEFHAAEQLAFARTALEDPAAAGWWLHYFVLRERDRNVLAGVGGYKGPPIDGVVEVGYSVVPSYQGQGIATEAVAGLIESARARGARTIRAETLPDLGPSIAVLRKLGFEPTEQPEPGVLGFRLEVIG